MRKKKMTFSEYENEIERLENIGIEPKGFWPTVEEIRTEIEPNVRHELPFLIWLAELNPTRHLSKEDKECSNYVRRLINSNLELVYDEEK